MLIGAASGAGAAVVTAGLEAVTPVATLGPNAPALPTAQDALTNAASAGLLMPLLFVAMVYPLMLLVRREAPAWAVAEGLAFAGLLVAGCVACAHTATGGRLVGQGFFGDD